jgi:hypothetical protein
MLGGNSERTEQDDRARKGEDSNEAGGVCGGVAAGGREDTVLFESDCEDHVGLDGMEVKDMTYERK